MSPWTVAAVLSKILFAETEQSKAPSSAMTEIHRTMTGVPRRAGMKSAETRSYRVMKNAMMEIHQTEISAILNVR